MDDDKKYTAENLRPRFHEFLEKTRVADVDGMMEYAEQQLPQVLGEHFGVACDTVYALRDHRLLDDARRRVQTDAELRRFNEQSHSLLSQSMKAYSNFLQSKYFQEKFSRSKKKATTPTPPPPEPKPRELTEGARKHVETERAWRNPELRKACLAHYGYQCQCCGMDFERLYGDAGKCFIEVHHLRPISTYDGEHEVNPLTDLAPLCSNCHSMIHRLDDDEMTLKKLRTVYTGPTWELKVKMDD